MSADGSVTIEIWGDGENKFRFAIGQWRELQERVNGRRIAMGLPPTGPLSLMKDLEKGDCWPDDIRDILRIGLVGAGMSVQEAHRKLVLYFDTTPPYQHNEPALVVLAAGLLGARGDKMDDSKKKTETPTSPSSSPTSTEPVRH
jgi:Phage tail tube protein, GTA-gp10